MKETRVRFNENTKRRDKKKLTNMLLSDLGVREVLFNDNVTVVIVEDGTEKGSKGVSKRSKEDYYDPIIGFSIAYMIAKANSNGKSHYVKDRIDFMNEEESIRLKSQYVKPRILIASDGNLTLESSGMSVTRKDHYMMNEVGGLVKVI